MMEFHKITLKYPIVIQDQHYPWMYIVYFVQWNIWFAS